MRIDILTTPISYTLVPGGRSSPRGVMWSFARQLRPGRRTRAKFMRMYDDGNEQFTLTFSVTHFTTRLADAEVFVQRHHQAIPRGRQNIAFMSEIDELAVIESLGLDIDIPTTQNFYGLDCVVELVNVGPLNGVAIDCSYRIQGGELTDRRPTATGQ